MAPKWYDDFLTDFDIRYSRWVAATEAVDAKETNSAAAELPTLNKRLLRRITDLDETEPNPDQRAVQKRLIVLTSEIAAKQERRRRKRREATQRHADRTVRVERTVELPSTCARCGARLDHPKTTGRPRLYCSPACRKAAYEDRRARRDGAVKVQVVEKVVTEVRERRVEVPHPRSDCVKAVLADDDAMLAVIWSLTALVRDRTRSTYGVDQPRFKNLSHHAEALYEALTQRARDSEP